MASVVMALLAGRVEPAMADYWMTFCRTPNGQRYAQVGSMKPDVERLFNCDFRYKAPSLGFLIEDLGQQLLLPLPVGVA